MRRRILALLRVNEHPDPPPGATRQLEIFRPSRRFFYYSIVRWLPKQLNALIGILVSLAFLGIIDLDLGFIDFDLPQLARFDEVLEAELDDVTVGLGPLRFELFRVVHYLEFLAIGAFLAQFIAGGFLLKLGWEMRWYMVGEKALRIRSGLWNLREQTMTVTNIQNMTIRQGPLQKLFGIADLEIHTAGGGAKKDDDDDKKPDHVGRLEGLENAEEWREFLRSRLVKDRGTGVGDVEEDDTPAEAPPPDVDRAPRSRDAALAAARRLLAEARELRRSLAGG